MKGLPMKEPLNEYIRNYMNENKSQAVQLIFILFILLGIIGLFFLLVFIAIMGELVKITPVALIIPIFIIIVGALVAAFYFLRQLDKQSFKKQREQASQRLEQYKAQLDNEIERQKADLQNQKEQYAADKMKVLRENWIKDSQMVEYKSELEVDTKFVHWLLFYLGYHDNLTEMQKSVTVRFGRDQSLNGRADWVAWKDKNNAPCLVIETKASGVLLDSEVQTQARSYAFALKAQKYLLTNVQQIQLYELGAIEDNLLLDIQIGELAEKWDELHKLVGNQKP